MPRLAPTPAGERSFMVDHPWYTERFDLAAGLTLDYAHNPLVFGYRTSGTFTTSQSVIEHQLIGHLDVSAAFLDRLNVAASFPIVLLERGAAVGGVAPNDGVASGDLRIGLMARLYGQPLGDAFSIHLGGQVWFPTSRGSAHTGDQTVRALVPKLVLAGLTHRLLWSFTGAYVYRSDAAIGTLPVAPGNTMGQEMQLGAALAYFDEGRRISLGPEVLVATVVNGGHAFTQDFTSLEVLGGAHWAVGRHLQFGLGVGAGVLREPGTPDVRVLARAAYVPSAEPEHKIEAPPPPPSDRDGDGLIDVQDRCPDEPMGPHPDADRPGCPERDRDGDGILDHADICPDEPAGPHPDAKRPGCPDKDSDGDGVFDSQDRCPDVPAGAHPDPDRPGCPVPDRDGDQVPDSVDACPDQPGAPDVDPKKNGCPGLVELKHGQIVIMEQIFFATAKDTLLPKSFPVLQAVANALKAKPDIKKVQVQGHTDSRGSDSYNLDLSQRRAASVIKWLTEHGIESDRLVAQGFGPQKPIATNKTTAGRAANRRVEFHILEPPQAESPSDPGGPGGKVQP